MERAEQPMGGGILATVTAMAVTYGTGAALEFTGWLSQAWQHVTPGQAALLIGLLTYGTHTGTQVFNWLKGRRDQRGGTRQ